MTNRSFAEIGRAFQIFLQDDNFNYLGIPGEVPMFPSIRDFVRKVALGNAEMKAIGQNKVVRFPDITNLKITFKSFLELSIEMADEAPIPVDKLIKMEICRAHIPDVLSKTARDIVSPSVKEIMFEECGVKDYQGWLGTFTSEPLATILTDKLMELLVSEHSAKSLLEFFLRKESPGQFHSWSPRSETDIGRKLKQTVLHQERYQITVDVAKYVEVDDTGVNAYEWKAHLFGSPDQIDAIAIGMVYVFDRSDGVPHSGRGGLMEVADSVADVDVLQVKSFLDQHPDADDLIFNGDLCFVWLWERREGSTKGWGADCLKLALSDIKKRFNRVRTVVFDTRPAQFIDWHGVGEPPMVATLKQDAIESLTAYIGRLELPKFEIRHIFNRTRNPHKDALLALHEELGTGLLEELQQRRGHGVADEFTQVPIEIDEEARHELCLFFQLAGLPELSDAIAVGEASVLDIEAALSYIFLDSRVNYVPVSRTVRQSEDFLSRSNRLEFEEIMETEPALLQFLDDLPDGVTETGMFANPDTVGQVSFYCVVSCATQFGVILGYYTLVPKSRPINVSQYLLG